MRPPSSAYQGGPGCAPQAARRAETRAHSGQLLGRWRLDRVAAAARGPHAFFSVEQIRNSKITEPPAWIR